MHIERHASDDPLASLAAIRTLLRQLTAAVDALDERLRASSSVVQVEARPSAPTTKLLFTLSEAAEVLGVSKSSMYVMMAAGELQYLLVGARRRITAAAIDEFIANAGKSAGAATRDRRP